MVDNLELDWHAYGVDQDVRVTMVDGIHHLDEHERTFDNVAIF